MLSGTPKEETRDRLRSGGGFLLDFHNRTVLFRAGDWLFTTYGLLASAAFFLGFATGLWYDAMLGSPLLSHAYFYVFVMLPMVLVGARLASILLEFRENAWRELISHPIATLVKPGYVLHGGVFGGAIADVVFSRWSGVPLLNLLDVCGFALPLGEAVCRLGCYVYGCCWGRPTDGNFGVCYHSPHAKVVRCAPQLRGVPLHPAQLYGTVAHGLQFACFVALLPHVHVAGFYAIAYFITHPILRFTLERLRFDDRGKFVGQLTQTQFYSLIQVALALLIGAWVMRTGGSRVTLNLALRWTDVAFAPQLSWLLAVVTFVVMLSFGLHYRTVGAWVGAPTSDRVAEDTQLNESDEAQEPSVESAALD